MASVIKAGNATDGVQVTSDNTGILELKTGTGSGTTAMTIGTDQSVTFAGAVSSSGNQTVTGNLTVDGNTTLGNANTDTILMTAAPSIGGAGLGMGFGFRNRIINGAMVIDQRNAGASVTPIDNQYALDRWKCRLNQASKFSVQQSSVASTGFNNSLLVTSLSAFTPAAGDYFNVQQQIEGFNFADLGWGTASAVSVTLSFWVRSSLTGTFAGRLTNSITNRVNVFTYSISSANTWEQKSVTIAGDTGGTWVGATNGVGVGLAFDLGSGSNFETSTTGSWITTDSIRTASSVRLISTNGATFYITGVQLEKGSTATSFDYRPYGTELQLCQRYYYKLQPAVQDAYGLGQVYNANSAICLVQFPVTMRTSPTSVETSGTASDYRMWKANSAVVSCTGVPAFDGSTSVICGGVDFTSTSLVGTAGQVSQCSQNNANGYLGWSAEL